MSCQNKKAKNALTWTSVEIAKKCSKLWKEVKQDNQGSAKQIGRINANVQTKTFFLENKKEKNNMGWKG